MRLHFPRIQSKTLLLGLVLLVALASVLSPVASADTTATGRVVQVNLATYAKISQYTDIDSSAQGYGKNACGLVAAAAAWGGDDWVQLVADLRAAAGKDYGNNTGIQPSKYVAALQKVFGAKSIREANLTTLDTLYQELEQGNFVIVDIQVNANTVRPSTGSPNFAHFARVLGMDMDREEIYIENTLSGAPYWTLTFDQFLKVWEYPETDVSLIPDPKNAEHVTNWAVILDNSPIT